MPRPLLLALAITSLAPLGRGAAGPGHASSPPASEPALAWPEIRQETKPWTRWWWFGNIADEASLTTEMEKYAAAGLGGLEITPIYGVRGYEDRFVPFLSPRWMELFAHTLAEARRLDLGIDLATGTGWPFGGPWLEQADAAHYLAHRVYSVDPGERLPEPIAFVQRGLVRTAGPRRVELQELRQPVTANADLQDLALDQVRFDRPLPLVALIAYAAGPARDAGRGGVPPPHASGPAADERQPHDRIALDLTDRVQPDGTLDWTAPADAGPWTLYALFRGPHGKMVERAAPGGEGFALDHFSSAALNNYLARFDRAFGEAGSGSGERERADASLSRSGERERAEASLSRSGERERAEPARSRAAAADSDSDRFPATMGAVPARSRSPLLAGLGVRAFFNDSYEVDDAEGEANWTPRFFEEFRQRRGYDLRARLPELFGRDGADAQPRVLSDFRETLSDLLLHEFTLPWRAWAHRQGASIRNQAHNSPASILDLYAASDIPEQEGNGFLAIKLASSAAHVTGKRLASAEAATWLDEHFLTTLAQLKANADEFLLSGINHLCYHGTPLSPPDDPWPGFQFYASVELSPANPLWNDFPALNAYVARAQSFLQSEPDSCYDRNTDLARAEHRPDEDLLLYYNIHDRWAERDGGRLPHFGHGGRDPVGVTAGAVAAQLHAAGFGFDYVSDRMLETVTVQDDAADSPPESEHGAAGTIAATEPADPKDPRGNPARPMQARGGARLDAPGASYRAIVVPPTTFMPAATLARLLAFAEAGAAVVFVDRLPVSAPGLHGLAQQQVFDKLIDRLRAFNEARDGDASAAPARGQVLIGDDAAALLARVPGLAPERLHRFGLDHLRRRLDGRVLYFVVNRTDQTVEGWIPFSTAAAAAALFDPMTGASGVAALRSPGTIRGASVPAGTVPEDGQDARASSEVYLQLPAGASCFVVLQREPLAGPAWHYWRPAGESRPIAGGWRVGFVRGGPALPAPVALPGTPGPLPSWTDFAGEAGRVFSGTAIYATDLPHPANDRTAHDAGQRETPATARHGAQPAAWQLDLGTVGDSARVRLNGREFAVLIQPPWRVAIPDAALGARNTLEVEVTNLAANRIADLDRRGVPWKKFYNANLPPRARDNAGPDRLFTAARWSPRNSGLLGPVTLTPLESFDPASR